MKRISRKKAVTITLVVIILLLVSTTTLFQINSRDKVTNGEMCQEQTDLLNSSPTLDVIFTVDYCTLPADGAAQNEDLEQLRALQLDR